jgi:hypothetical protein
MIVALLSVGVEENNLGKLNNKLIGGHLFCNFE